MQRMEGDLANTLSANLEKIAHIQIADNPGRHEPGTGEINFGFLFAHLDRIGYKGWVGCEYKPAAATEAGLAWLPTPMTPIRAIAFDAYGTLFDVYSVGALAEQLFPGKGAELAAQWRDTQIGYTRMRTLVRSLRAVLAGDGRRAGLLRAQARARSHGRGRAASA